MPYHFLQSVITKITGAVIVACSSYFYINGTISAVYAIGMTISAFMLYASLECAGNYSSLLHVVSVCVDKGNEELICLANFSEYGQNGEENEKI